MSDLVIGKRFVVELYEDETPYLKEIMVIDKYIISQPIDTSQDDEDPELAMQACTIYMGYTLSDYDVVHFCPDQIIKYVPEGLIFQSYAVNTTAAPPKPTKKAPKKAKTANQSINERIKLLVEEYMKQGLSEKDALAKIHKDEFGVE